LHGLAIAAAFWSEPAEAVTLLEEALALHRLGEDPFGVPLALVQLASVHASLGDLDVAMGYAEECIALSEPRHERWCAGLARWAQALVAWRQGRPTAARGFARKALDLKTPFGDRLGMAMSMEIVAWDLAVQGRSEESATLLGAVDTALSSVGGGLFRYLHGDRTACEERLREALGSSAYDEARRRGVALAFPDALALAAGRRRSGAGGAPLTPRETEIARLVADGLSNREVADRLVTSRRTVEGHVARILTKLGLESRTQLSAWVAEQLPPV
jgi:non-specific serine/threonine protein kinase